MSKETEDQIITIRYLTDDPQEQKACNDYWLFLDGKFPIATKEIASRIGVSHQLLTKQIALWCKAFSQADACNECKQYFWVYKSRTEFIQRQRRNPSWTCPECKKARAALEAEKQEKRRHQIVSWYQRLQRPKLCLSDSQHPLEPISLQNAVALLSVIRLAASEDLTQINPLVELDHGKLSPTHEYDTTLLYSLTSSALTPNPERSQIEAFEFEGEEKDGIGEFRGTFYIYYATYDIPSIIDPKSGADIDAPYSIVNVLETLLSDSSQWPASWSDERLSLWRELAIQESLQYLVYCLKEHSLDFSPGEKTHQVLDNVLTTHSTAQTYNLIWRAARDAAAYYLRESISKRQAANSIVSRIQSSIDRARTDGWDIKRYRRVWECPQSAYSKVFFNVALKIGDLGFAECPSSNILRDLP